MVIESLTDMVTFLATCCSAMCSGAELEPPITDTASNEELSRWVHKLSAFGMTLWRQQLISFEDMLAANVPGFTYNHLLLDCGVEKMQPGTWVTPQKETDRLSVARLNDANINPGKVKNASTVSDPSTTANTN